MRHRAFLQSEVTTLMLPSNERLNDVKINILILICIRFKPSHRSGGDMCLIKKLNIGGYFPEEKQDFPQK